MKRFLILLLTVTGFTTLRAQQRPDTIEYSLNAFFNGGSGHYAPFLSTVNQFDRYSITPNGFSTWGTLHKASVRTFDYGFGAEVSANMTPTESRLFPGEFYVEGKIGPFLAVLGMKREVFGNQDAELSSGGLLYSRNSRPIPALTLETDGWVDVPFSNGYLEFSGGMANGKFTDVTVTKNTMMHHKWLHGRMGGSFPVTINYGLHHVAQWAGESPVYGESKANLENFMRVFMAKSGSIDGPATEYFNALGNHIVSQNLGLGLKLTNVSVDLYWQNINEDKPILRMNKAYNKRDGLWGVSIRLPKFKPLHSIVTEFVSTTDQNGPWHDLDGVILGGTDGYYNNGVYPNGWSFYGMAVGNPWLTSPIYNTDGGVGFQNNCVRLFYVAGMGEVNDFKYRFTTAYSKNWGLAARVMPPSKDQFSGQLEVSHALPFVKNTEASLGVSCDRGSKYGNNLAILMGLRYDGHFLLNGK